jgi:hemerythrin
MDISPSTRSRLAWTPQLSVGIPEIDAQHQDLFIRANGLMEAMSSGRGTSEIASTIEFLAQYTLAHFETEERYMRELRYPGLSAHLAQHKAFVTSFLAIKRNVEAQGATVSLTLQVQKQVMDWLRSHVAKTDKEYGVFLQSMAA